MINKQNLWFSFLFSVILVLSIFYISMDNEKISDFEIKDSEESLLTVNNYDTELVALRIKSDEEELESIQKLQEILLSQEADVSKKNDAYNDLIMISNNKVLEEKLERVIKNKFGYDSFIKVNGQNVTVVVKADKNDYVLANQIIREINSLFTEDKYVTVKFN